MYTGCNLPLHVLALITTDQQLDEQMQKVFLAERNYFWKSPPQHEFAVLLSNQHGMSTVQEAKSTNNMACMDVCMSNMSLWEDLLLNLAKPRTACIFQILEIPSWLDYTDSVFCAHIHSIPAKWEGEIGAECLGKERAPVMSSW